MNNERKNRKEQAVSPVVGVMLMLVVTIIIAAVVSAFAGGLTSGTQKAPQAVIDATITRGDNGMGVVNTSIDFKLVSGDSLNTKDLSIITYYTNKSGITLKHEQTASSPVVDLYQGTAYSPYNSRVPYLNNIGKGWANGVDLHFGNFTWVPGDKISTGNDFGTASLLGMGSIDGHILDPDLTTGSIVDVKILHVPSGKYILDKEVVAS